MGIDKLLGKWTKDRVDAMNVLMNEIVRISENDEQIPNLDKIKLYASSNDLLKKLQECQVDSTKEIRTLSYRILEFLLPETDYENLFNVYHWDVFLSRTLIRDARYDVERQQAMSLLFKYLEQPEGPSSFPLSMVRVLVSLAEQLDDRLRNTAIELLCELVLRNPSLVAYAGGLRSIFQSLLEGPVELLKPVIRTFLFLLDTRETRSFVRPHLELENVISQFTDAYTAKGTYPMDKLQTCAAAIQEILSSWTGLYFFCVGNKQAILSIIEALSLPNDDIRNLLLALLQSLLGCLIEIEKFEWAIQFQALCLMVFLDAGLMEALISVILNGSPSSCDLSFVLLSDILTICSKRLPKSYDDKVQALPILFASASNFQNEPVRQFAREKLTKIFKAHMDGVSLSLTTNTSTQEILDWRPDTLWINMEEILFRTLLNDSEVNGMKDYTKWNWNAISELMKGSLLNPKRFDELVRTTKFASRMIQFLKPSSKQFCDLPMDENGPKIVSSCRNFLCSLSSSTPGYRFLIENRLLNEISEKLARLGDPSNFELDTTFSKEKIENCLAGEYFTFLGDVQRLADGDRIMEDHSLWSIFYVLIQLRGRDDITKRIVSSGNYSYDGHIRIILSKLLSAGYKEMRLFSTSFIGTLLSKNTPGLEEWAPQVLVPQLFDPAPAVSLEALRLVKDFCKSRPIIESLIACGPDIEHLASHDSTILMEILKVPSGYQYLLHQGYIDLEIKYWFEFGVFQYVITADTFMNMENVFDSTCEYGFLGHYPPHFIGNLATTEQGCDYLSLRKELFQILSFLVETDPSATTEDNFLIKLKAAIWIVAHIGSSERGFEYLSKIYPNHNMINILIGLLKSSDTLSIRGTCLFAISLIAKSRGAQEQLEGLQWSIKDGICIPNQIDDLFDIPLWEFEGSWPNKRTLTFKAIDYRLNETEKEILKCIGNLSNHIVASANSKRLVALKQSNPDDFNSVQLYIMSVRIMADYQFKLQSRRFVQDLFDKFVWDIPSLLILQKSHGLVLDTPLKMSVSAQPKTLTKPLSASPVKTVKKTAEQDAPSRSFASTYSLANLVTHFQPGKVLKGGFQAL